MDAQAVPPGLAGADEPRPPIGQAEFRTILSNLSQELCRPLVSLRMGFDLLLSERSGQVSADQRGHVQTMIVLCDDMLRLTRSYLDYAGLVEGTRPLSVGAFTVGALIREIDLQFGPSAVARGVAWECRLDGRDATVTTDASRCQQIFGNLVANALKYTPEGGEVRVEGKTDAGGWVVTVEDTGPGIPDAHIDRVFEPFYRLGRDEGARANGSGLGLAVCRALVDQLGGQIRMDSGVGEGTRVTVRFPAVVSARGAAPGARGQSDVGAGG